VFQSEDDEFDADREEVNMEEDVTSPDETDVSEVLICVYLTNRKQCCVVIRCHSY